MARRRGVRVVFLALELALALTPLAATFFAVLVFVVFALTLGNSNAPQKEILAVPRITFVGLHMIYSTSQARFQ